MLKNEQIARSGHEQSDRIVGFAKDMVAIVTEQRANVSRPVVVVNGKQEAFAFADCGFGFLADSAEAILRDEHSVVVGRAQAEYSLDAAVSARFGRSAIRLTPLVTSGDLRLAFGELLRVGFQPLVFFVATLFAFAPWVSLMAALADVRSFVHAPIVGGLDKNIKCAGATDVAGMLATPA